MNFMPGWMPSVFPAEEGSSAVTLDFLTSVVDTSNQTANPPVYTFSSVSFGAADSNRVIAVAAFLAVNSDISDVTIGGVTGTLAGSQIIVGDTSFIDYRAGIWYAEVPTGTSGSIVITGSGTTNANQASIGVWRIITANSTPSATASDADDADATNAVSLTIPTDGCGIAWGFAFATSGLTGGTWTNLTEDFDEACENQPFNNFPQRHSGASSTTAGSATRSLAWNGTGGTASGLVSAAWGPT